MDKPQIRNALATPAGNAGVQWVCQPELGIDDRVCGVCRTQRLKLFATGCPCHAKIQWDMG